MLHQAQGLPSHITTNAYESEEKNFLKHCTRVYVSEVPPDANIISSHLLYKIKELDDGSRMCRGRIASHGNKDREKNSLKKDSASCPPLGIRILLSVYTLFGFFLSKIDFKGAFLQSGPANRKVYA